MKIRTGFVSNSSSSSFMCGVCKCEFIEERGTNPLLCKECIESFEYPLAIHLTKEDVKSLTSYYDSIGEIIVKQLKELNNEN
jgi:hypothetical protein